MTGKLANPPKQVNKKTALKAKQYISACLGENRLAEAEAQCLSLCKACPNDPEAWSLLGFLEGRRARHDRAAAAYRKAIGLRPDYYEALYNLGSTLLETGDGDEASKVFQQALRVRPDAVDVINNLGVLLRNRGDIDAAAAHFRRATRLEPRHPMAWYNLGKACLAQGDPEQAVACLRKAVALRPRFAEAFHAMGDACRQIFLREEAVDCYRQALRINPGFTNARSALAEVLILLGRHDEAIRCFDEILASDGGNLEALAGKAEALERNGDIQAAYEVVLPYAAAQVNSERLAITFANLCGRYGACDDALAWIDRLLAEGALTAEQTANLHQAKGKLLDRRNDYTGAFRHFDAANRLKKSFGRLSRHNEDIDASLAFFSSAALSGLPHSTIASELPVFIVGMPRSGTSLVEQIIASHPEAYGAGELPYIHRYVSSLPALVGVDKPFPQCLTDLSTSMLDALAKEYLAYLERVGGGARRVTDKLPHNFMWLSLIELMFPKAKIVHCVRDPMDNCLSLYTTRGFNAHHSYAFDLEQLGMHYLKYQEMMSEWKRQLQLPIHEVRYEKLVLDFESEARSLIEFCELDWDEQCMRFYSSGRAAATLSYDQVRKPIYNTSMGRWRHYQGFLGPLINVLRKEGR